MSVWGWGTTKLGREAIGLQQLPLRVPARQDTGLQTLASSCTLSPASACRRLRQQAGQCMQFVAARKRTTAIVNNAGVGSIPGNAGRKAQVGHSVRVCGPLHLAPCTCTDRRAAHALGQGGPWWGVASCLLSS